MRIPFIGPMPPPVHGQAVATQTVANALTEAGVPLRIVSTGRRPSSSKHGFYRAWAHLSAVWQCFFAKSPGAYISVGADNGMYAVALMALFGRMSGKRIVLHHHSYGYIAQEARRMAVLLNLAGPDAIHLTLCAAMSADIKRMYPQLRRTIEYSNIGSVDGALLALSRQPRPPKVLGFMSNLTMEKGVGRVIDAFRAAKNRGLAERLVVAGPCRNPAARAAIDTATTEFGPAFEHLGSVRGARKVGFFRDIDVFLFPSLYHDEAQPIVSLEALAAGLPIITFGVGGIPDYLAAPSCRIVPPKADFSEATCGFLQELHSGLFNSAPDLSREQFQRLAEVHELEKQRLLEALAAK